jgi:hypothetical protein
MQNETECGHAERDSRKRQQNLNGRVGAGDPILPGIEFARYPMLEFLLSHCAACRVGTLGLSTDPPQHVANNIRATPARRMRPNGGVIVHSGRRTPEWR